MYVQSTTEVPSVDFYFYCHIRFQFTFFILHYSTPQYLRVDNMAKLPDEAFDRVDEITGRQSCIVASTYENVKKLITIFTIMSVQTLRAAVQ